MFGETALKGWSQTYGTGKEYEERYNSIYNLLKSLKLGNCYRDEGGNYIVYSFTKKKFYFFDHELDGEENIKQNEWSLEKIKKYIDECNE